MTIQFEHTTNNHIVCALLVAQPVHVRVKVSRMSDHVLVTVIPASSAFCVRVAALVRFRHPQLEPGGWVGEKVRR